jgi:general secretion pathway protein F
MIGAFIAVIKMVVPQFKEMFEESGGELPMPTQILLGIEEFVKVHGFMILITIIAVIFVHITLYNQKGRYKYLADKYILKVYLLGKITRLSMTGRFMFVFNKLTNSGIPIIKSLSIAKNIVENDYLKEKFASIEESIEEGKPLTQGFKDSGEFENMIIQMVKAGETSGSLNKMLEKVDIYYSAKYGDLIDNISTYIEPIMIAFLAAFLTLMALGIFLPMWNMVDLSN